VYIIAPKYSKVNHLFSPILWGSSPPPTKPTGVGHSSKSPDIHPQVLCIWVGVDQHGDLHPKPAGPK